jgi:hypothetical protein
MDVFDLVWVNRKKKLAKFRSQLGCRYEYVVPFDQIDNIRCLQKKDVQYLNDDALDSDRVVCVYPHYFTRRDVERAFEEARRLTKLLYPEEGLYKSELKPHTDQV